MTKLFVFIYDISINVWPLMYIQYNDINDIGIIIRPYLAGMYGHCWLHYCIIIIVMCYYCDLRNR